MEFNIYIWKHILSFLFDDDYVFLLKYYSSLLKKSIKLDHQLSLDKKNYSPYFNFNSMIGKRIRILPRILKVLVNTNCKKDYINLIKKYDINYDYDIDRLNRVTYNFIIKSKLKKNK